MKKVVTRQCGFCFARASSFAVGPNMFGPARGDHSQTLALVLTHSIPPQGHGQSSLSKCNHCKLVQKYDTHTHILKATFFTKGNHSQILAQVLTDFIPRSHSVYVPFSCGILSFSTQLRNSIKMLFSPLTQLFFCL